MSVLYFLPFMALVASMSLEVAADSTAVPTVTKYDQLKEAGALGMVEGIKISYDVKNVDAEAVPANCLDNIDECKVLTSESDGSKVLIKYTLTEGFKTFGDLEPEKVQVRMCFSPSSGEGKKWRKLNKGGLIKKDNSCKTSGKAGPRTDMKPVVLGEEVAEEIAIEKTTPTGLYAMRVYVKCKGQEGDNEFCAVHNYVPKPGSDKAIFFKNEAIDSRPANLWAAVLICAFIGPILLFAFLIYERLYLAKLE